jgi:hypothetical protein
MLSQNGALVVMSVAGSCMSFPGSEAYTLTMQSLNAALMQARDRGESEQEASLRGQLWDLYHKRPSLDNLYRRARVEGDEKTEHALLDRIWEQYSREGNRADRPRDHLSEL